MILNTDQAAVFCSPSAGKKRHSLNESVFSEWNQCQELLVSISADCCLVTGGRTGDRKHIRASVTCSFKA